MLRLTIGWCLVICLLEISVLSFYLCAHINKLFFVLHVCHILKRNLNSEVCVELFLQCPVVLKNRFRKKFRRCQFSLCSHHSVNLKRKSLYSARTPRQCIWKRTSSLARRCGVQRMPQNLLRFGNLPHSERVLAHNKHEPITTALWCFEFVIKTLLYQTCFSIHY